MKELTIEQKAKAYGKVREKITLRFGSNVTEEIFSEFEMSEDEKIRKQILSFLKEFERDHYRNIDFSSWIVWLEKTAEETSWKPSKEQINALEHFVRSIAESGYASPYDDNTKLMYSLLHDLEKLETTSEQKSADKVEPKDYNAIDPIFGKPIDKVEPKFHEGEWVVWNDKYYKVNYNGCGYELIDQDGLHTSLEYGTVDENAHIFSISDAKDGDVLVTQKTNVTYESIFIFKKIENNRIIQYLHYFTTDAGEDVCEAMSIGGFIGFVGTTVHPATKEQRDALEWAMTNAGYRWDKEKFKLEKI